MAAAVSPKNYSLVGRDGWGQVGWIVGEVFVCVVLDGGRARCCFFLQASVNEREKRGSIWIPGEMTGRRRRFY